MVGENCGEEVRGVVVVVDSVELWEGQEVTGAGKSGEQVLDGGVGERGG